MKKIIISSILTIALCLSLIVGSTFALFTSETSANIAVNSATVKVVATINDSTLDTTGIGNAGTTAEIVDGKLVLTNFAPKDKVEFDIDVKNESNIAIAYKVTSDADNFFGGALSVTTTAGLNVWNYVTTPGGDISSIHVVVEFLNADNNKDYMNQTANVEFAIEAVQGNGVTEVADAEALVAAIAEGGTVVLTDNVTVTDTITVSGDTVLELGEYTINAENNSSRPIEMADGASLVINASDAEPIVVGNYGLINIPGGNSADVTINGGNFVGSTENGSLIRLRSGSTDDVVNVTLNNVTYSDAGTGRLLDSDGFEGSASVTVNGGSFTSSNSAGFTLDNVDLTVNDAEILTAGVAFEISAGSTATIENTEIKVHPGVTVVNAPAAAVAASYGGQVEVIDCNIIIETTNTKAFYTYNSGGDIVVNGCTGVLTYQCDPVQDTTYATTASITIDGTVVASR